jgi:hypothetical protein
MPQDFGLVLVLRILEESIVVVPGMMETVLRALSTLKVLRPARFPISTNEVR